MSRNRLARSAGNSEFVDSSTSHRGAAHSLGGSNGNPRSGDMSIQIITDEDDRARPTFTCDQCRRAIKPEEGILLWNPVNSGAEIHDSTLVCNDCHTDDQRYSLPLEAGLIYLLVLDGWLNQRFEPTAKLLLAARNATDISEM